MGARSPGLPGRLGCAHWLLLTPKQTALNIAGEEVRTIFSLGGLGPPSSQVSSLEASQDLGVGVEGFLRSLHSVQPWGQQALGKMAVKDRRKERVGGILVEGSRAPLSDPTFSPVCPGLLLDQTGCLLFGDA